MYKFDKNYWIVHSYTPYDGLVQSCGVRRCNNFLRIIDPLNGALVKIPCIVDYDMSSPSMQTSKYIITPNNHAVIMVQGNDLTHRLLKTNTRYILGGRPFKLLAYQNAIEDDVFTPENTLMYLDLYLDEIHDKDDIAKGIADNGDYNYNVFIDAKNMTVNTEYVGKLSAIVLLNGENVERNVVWSSSNNNIIKVEEDGTFYAIGNNGKQAVVKVALEGNDKVFSEILISINEEEHFAPHLFISNSFETIRQYDKVTFYPCLSYGDINYYEFDEVSCVLNGDADKYVDLIINNDNSYTIQGLKISPEELSFTISVVKNDPSISISQDFSFRVVSMLG